MKAKSLFLVFALSLLLPFATFAAEKTDTYSAPGSLVVDEIPISGALGTSGATYAGTVGYDSELPCFVLDQECICATTLSPGTVKAITITWADDDEFYNTPSQSAIFVYGSETAFDGSETLGDLAAAGKPCIGTLYYSAPGAVSVTLSAHPAHIAIVGAPTEAAVESISITWTVPDVTTYTLTGTVGSGKGKVTFSPKSPVAEGAEVTVTMKAGSGNELRSFTIDGATTVLTEDEYTGSEMRTFTMPAHAVTVTANFATAPSRVANPIYVNGTVEIYETTIPSGVDSVYTISTAAAYTAGWKSITSTNNRVKIVSTTSPVSGVSQLTLRGLVTGSDEIVINTYQTNGFLRASKVIRVTVVPREVILVTELNGKHYALTHTIGGATATALELIKQGANYYYKSDVTPSSFTWDLSYANDAGDIYLKNGAQYLSIKAANMSLSGSAFTWSHNAEDVLITDYLTSPCYNEKFSAFTVETQSQYEGVTTISAPIVEVSTDHLFPASSYSRSLTSGNYATMCLPFPVSRNDAFFSGVDVFNLTGKYVSAGKVTGIEIEEETGALVAGKPYIIQATASTLSAWYGVASAVSPVAATGLVGNLSASPLSVPDGCYGFKSNKLHKVAGGTATIGQCKAYVDLSAVPEIAAGASAPGRISIYTDDSDDEETPTSVDQLLEHATFINWNEPVYNTLGQRVGRGSTGVLIQNGQKFLVQ